MKIIYITLHFKLYSYVIDFDWNGFDSEYSIPYDFVLISSDSKNYKIPVFQIKYDSV